MRLELIYIFFLKTSNYPSPFLYYNGVPIRKIFIGSPGHGSMYGVVWNKASLEGNWE